MPIYAYRHPTNNSILELAQSVNDKHEYIDKDGIKWERIFFAPEINTNGKLKAETSAREFSEFTKHQKGTVGDLWDRSKELSEKREKIYGKDPVKEVYKKNWSKKRKNRRFLE